MFRPIFLLNEGADGCWLEWLVTKYSVIAGSARTSMKWSVECGLEPRVLSRHRTERFTSSTIKGSAEALRTRDGIETRERYSLHSPDVSDGSMGERRSPPVIELVSVRCWFRYSTKKCHSA